MDWRLPVRRRPEPQNLQVHLRGFVMGDENKVVKNILHLPTREVCTVKADRFCTGSSRRVVAILTISEEPNKMTIVVTNFATKSISGGARH